MVKVPILFDVHSGDFHALKELEPGGIPLVSCGDTDNGVIGYYDIPEKKQYCNRITVAYNGSWPIMAKFHSYTFGAKDDVAVLLSKYDMDDLEMLYVAALFNRMTWRYSYGRKCFREKLEQVDLPIATAQRDGRTIIDHSAVAAAFPAGVRGLAQKIARGAWMGMEPLLPSQAA